MNMAKIYQDCDGNDCTIHQIVKREPSWAASRIRIGEEALAILEAIKRWDIETYVSTGKYALPVELRSRVQNHLQ